MVKKYDEVIKALNHVRFNNPQYNNKWLTAKNWCKLMKKHWTFDDGIDFTTKLLGQAVGRKFETTYSISNLKVTNEVKFYKFKRRGSGYYCSMLNNKLPSRLPGQFKVDEWPKIDSFDALNDFPTTRKRSSEELVSGAVTQSGSKKPMRKKQNSISQQQRRATRSTGASDATILPDVSTMNSEERTHSSVAAHQLPQGYWIDTRTIGIFGLHEPLLPQDNGDIRTVIKERISKLRVAYQQPGGYKDVVDDGDSMGLYSEHDQFVLQWYCRYLVKALQIALEKVPTITWEASCTKAINMVNKEEGWARPVLTCSRTLQRFHLRYRRNKECILNKHLINTNKTKSRVDKLFDAYPDAKSSMETFMRSHLNELSCELVWDHFHEKILPKLVDDRKQERIDNGDAEEDPANADFGSKEFLSELHDSCGTDREKI